MIEIPDDVSPDDYEDYIFENLEKAYLDKPSLDYCGTDLDIINK